MPDYKEDVAIIIGEWDTLVTLKRDTPTYNDRGEPTHDWDDVTTAYVDIQPANEKQLAYMTELGMEEIYTHKIYGYYDTAGAKITPVINDRFYDADDKIYEIKQIKEYENSHFDMYAIYMEGKV